MMYSRRKIQKYIFENLEYDFLENLEIEGIKHKGTGLKSYAGLIFIKNNLYIFNYNIILGFKFNYFVARVTLLDDDTSIPKEIMIPPYIAESFFINKWFMYIYLKNTDGFRLKYNKFDDTLSKAFNKYFTQNS